ncbi:MAG: response regulator [Alphaproteobacteria bacterium]
MPNLVAPLSILLLACVALNLAVTLVLWRRWARGRLPSDTGTDAASLDNQRALLSDALESISEGFALFDRDGRLVLCNENYRNAYPRSADMLVPGTRFAEILRAEAERGACSGSAKEVEAWVQERLTRPLASAEPLDMKLSNDRWYRISEHQTRSGGVVKLLTDITEVKRHEKALQRAQKMEALGQLAGGLAHEFNNLLTAIGGFSELARRRIENPRQDRKRIAKLLDEVVSGVQRAAALTRQMLTFSRRQKVETTVIATGDAVRAIEGMLLSLLTDGIQVEIDLQDNDAPIEVDPSLLEQCIINLALNSRDAMADGGTLTVSTRVVTLDEDFAAAHKGAKPGPHAAISVTDTGVGMTATTVTRIFEPFFSTKGPAKGTGLGLAIVYGFVRQCGGIVTVESLRGKGSSLTIHLPLATGPAKVVDPILAPRGGAVLVVDDEQTVRDFVTLALEELGYDVWCAASAEEALAVLERQGEAIDLVLTDVVMPDTSGPDLARQIAERTPDLTVIFMSGYENRRLAKERMVASDEVCLFKPFTQETLDQAVRQAIGKKIARARADDGTAGPDGETAATPRPYEMAH